ncbi:hypothetical protein AVT98_gp45 [Sulfolobales virus YNP1]|uniref:hypothetical protein n=1 Tax=Sulfolobales virus YNP1 TaxID=1732179 RepID=UPI000706140B|nr:hypothetical protein AVT98_gp45 [Sulfolobales virus YNP1]ALG97137.1 hypothetical protein [Sulfolobales virus YNP1]
MIKKYMALLKAQYTPTKLYNYLTQFEPHQNAVILYGNILSVKSIALLKNVKVKRVVSPPIILSYPFDVYYDEDDVVLYTKINDALPDEVKQRVKSILSRLKCIKMMKGKNGNLYLLTVNGVEECQPE